MNITGQVPESAIVLQVSGAHVLHNTLCIEIRLEEWKIRGAPPQVRIKARYVPGR